MTEIIHTVEAAFYDEYFVGGAVIHYFSVQVQPPLTAYELELAEKAGFRLNGIEQADGSMLGILRVEGLEETGNDTVTDETWRRTIRDKFLGFYRLSGTTPEQVIVHYPSLEV